MYLLLTDQYRQNIERAFDVNEAEKHVDVFTEKETSAFWLTPFGGKKYLACRIKNFGAHEVFSCMFYNENGGTEKRVPLTDLFTAIENHLRQIEFVAHGTYCISNSGGYEVEISKDGDGARVRDAYGSENQQVSDWLPIVSVLYQDGEGEEESEEFHPIIDPDGLNIPLNLVMRIR